FSRDWSSDVCSSDLVAEVISADQPDVDSTPNNDDGDQSEDDEASVIIKPKAVNKIDLELFKSTNKSTPNVGEIVRWTLTLTNNAANATTSATGVKVQDYMPAGVSLVAATSSVGTSFNTLTGVWSINTPLAPGQTVQLFLDVQVNQGTAGQTIKDVAEDR